MNDAIIPINRFETINRFLANMHKTNPRRIMKSMLFLTLFAVLLSIANAALKSAIKTNLFKRSIISAVASFGLSIAPITTLTPLPAFAAAIPVVGTK